MPTAVSLQLATEPISLLAQQPNPSYPTAIRQFRGIANSGKNDTALQRHYVCWIQRALSPCLILNLKRLYNHIGFYCSSINL